MKRVADGICEQAAKYLHPWIGYDIQLLDQRQFHHSIPIIPQFLSVECISVDIMDDGPLEEVLPKATPRKNQKF